jgi:hypothetical protein
MPPRKRAQATPKPEPDGSASDPQEGQAAADEVEGVAKEPTPPIEPEPDPVNAEQPCADCFPAGWPADATSAGCGHGTWNRTL